MVRSFDPPVVHVPDGTAIMQTGQGPVSVKVRRVLNDGTPGRPALRLPEVDGDTVVTHGASFGRANQFFGPLVTLVRHQHRGARRPVPAAGRRARPGRTRASGGRG